MYIFHIYLHKGIVTKSLERELLQPMLDHAWGNSVHVALIVLMHRQLPRHAALKHIIIPVYMHHCRLQIL